MPSAETSRSPRTTSRRPLVGLVIVVSLCLIAFALGVFIGKSQQSTLKNDVVATAQVKPVTHAVALKPAAPLTADTLAPGATVNNGAALAPLPTDEQSVEQVLHASAGAVKVADELSVQSLAAVEQSPLGNGINSNTAVVGTTPAAATALAIKAAPVNAPPAPATKVAVVVKRAPGKALHGAVYVVQVGSFKNRRDAATVQRRVSAHFPVNIKRADLGSKGIWFRVVVGPAATAAEAGKLKTKLHDDYKLSGFVKKVTL